MDDSCLKQPLLWSLTNGDFHSIILSMFICWNSTVKNNFACLLACFKNGLIDSYSIHYYQLFYYQWDLALQAGSCVPLIYLHPFFAHISILCSLPYFPEKQAVSGSSSSFPVPVKEEGLADFIGKRYLENKVGY